MAEAPKLSPLLTPTNPSLSAEMPTSVPEDTQRLIDLGFELYSPTSTTSTTAPDQSQQLTDLGFEEYSPEGFKLSSLISKPASMVGTGFGKATSRLMGSDIPDDQLANIYIDIARLAPQIYGGFKGGKYGLRAGQALTAPLPPSPLKGGIIAATTLGGTTLGSVTGAGSPEALMAMPDFLLGTEFQEKYGTDPAAIRTLLEGEALLELLTPGVLGAGRATARTSARVLTGINKVATDLAERAAERGINLMPVQLGRGYRGDVGRMYVSVLGRFPFVAGPFKNVAKQLDQEAQDYLRTIKNKTGLNLDQVIARSTLGEKILKDGKELLAGFAGHFGRRYDQQDALAAANNIYVIPDALVSKAEDIKRSFLQRTLSETGETASRDQIDTINNKFISWLDDNVLNMKVGSSPIMRQVVNPRTGVPRRSLSGPVMEEIPRSEGLTEFGSVPQSFKVAENLDQQIESFMADLTVDQQKLIQPHLGQLRQALSLDLTDNLRQFAEPITPNRLRQGQPLPELLEQSTFLTKFAEDARQLDADFSKTMNDLFETPTANRFTRWNRGGLRGRGASLEKATQLDLDTVARNLVNLGGIKSIDEFYNIVKPETYDDAVASYLNDAFFKATRRQVENEAGDMVEVASDAFDAGKFIKALGLDLSKADPRYKNIKHFFDKSKLYSMDELEKMADIFRTMSNTEIPDVSTFITRRIQLGGLKTLLPIGAVATGGFGGIAPLALALGGGRLLSSILADPLNARALKNVLAQESARGTKKMNTIRLYGNLLRGGLRTMFDTGGFENLPGEDPKQAYLDRRAATDVVLDVYSEAMDDPAQFAQDQLAEAQALEEVYLGDPVLQRAVDLGKSFFNSLQSVEDVADYIKTIPPQASASPPPFSPMTQNVPAPPIDVTQLPQQPVQVAQAPASPESREQYAAMFPNDIASGVIRSGIGSLV